MASRKFEVRDAYIDPGVETFTIRAGKVVLGVEYNLIKAVCLQLRAFLAGLQPIGRRPELHAPSVGIRSPTHKPKFHSEPDTHNEPNDRAYPVARTAKREPSACKTYSCSSTATPAAGLPIAESRTAFFCPHASQSFCVSKLIVLDASLPWQVTGDFDMIVRRGDSTRALVPACRGACVLWAAISCD